MLRRFLRLTIQLAAVSTAFAASITFDPQCPSGQTANGPCSALFSTVGNAQTLNIATPVGNVVISGGALFDHIANLPADQTAVYGTAGNGAAIGVSTGAGFTDPLTVTFPVPITSFSLDLFNGNTINVTYRLSDNAGDTDTFALGNNFSGGHESIGFVNNATVVTIAAITGQSTPGGMTWDFLIDNITYTPVPEPAVLLMMGFALAATGYARRSRYSAP